MPWPLQWRLLPFSTNYICTYKMLTRITVGVSPVQAEASAVVPPVVSSPAENGDATPAASKASGQKAKSGEQQVPSGSRSFQRVKAEEWLGKKGAWNNSYSATFGESGWGAKAEAVLGTVRTNFLVANKKQ